MNRFKTKKRFGQHFLKDQSILSGICREARLSGSDFCVEIGPGQAALTNHLLETGANIHAIEIDQRLEPLLKRLVNSHKQFSYTLADVLTVDFNAIYPHKDITVVGNLPYEISTPLLFRMIEHRSNITSMVFLLQKEVVDRLTAQVGTNDYGRLSVMIQYYFNTEGLMVVGPEAFSPPPKVVSQVVKLTPIERTWVEHQPWEQFVKYFFAQKRKMLRQRFKGYLESSDWEQLGIEPTMRPQEVSLDKLLKMYSLLLSRDIRF